MPSLTDGKEKVSLPTFAMQPETRPRGFITTQRLTAESRAKFLRTRAQLAPLEQAANTPFYEQGGNRDVRFELFDVQRTRAAMTFVLPDYASLWKSRWISAGVGRDCAAPRPSYQREPPPHIRSNPGGGSRQLQVQWDRSARVRESAARRARRSTEDRHA